MPRPSILYMTVVALPALLVASTSADALDRRPTISSPKQCTLDATAGKATVWCEGLICSCCYSDGCYICDSQGNDCVWDASRSYTRVPVTPDLGVLEPLRPAEQQPLTPMAPGGAGAGLLGP